MLRGGRAARWAVPAGDGKEGLKSAVGGVCAGCGVLRRRFARRVCVAVARGNLRRCAPALRWGRRRLLCGNALRAGPSPAGTARKN